jgi:outer membrane protein
MRKILKSTVIILITIFVLGAFTTGSSFAEYKFGYVDVNKIFNSYKKTVEADKALEKKQEEIQKQRQRMVEEIREMKDKMELLSDEAKEGKQKQINEKIRELQEFDREKRNELLKERDDAAQKIVKELDKVIKRIGKEEGYTYIFNERFILYGENQYDLTEKVLKALNR